MANYVESIGLSREGLKAFSEYECVSTLLLLFRNLLEVLVDDCDREEDTRTRSNSTHEVRENGKCPNAAAAESSSSRNVPVQILHHRILSLTLNHELLVHQLSRHVSGAGARDIDPDSGEEGAGGQDEDGVDDRVDWVLLDVIQTLRWADVVREATDGSLVASHVIVLPFAKEADDQVAAELAGQDLGEEVDVRHECSLKDDRNVRSVEQFDWVWLLEAAHLSR